MSESPPLLRFTTVSRPWSRNMEGMAILGFWVLLGTLSLVRRALDPRGPDGLTQPELFVTLAEYGLWALLTPGIFWLARRLPLERTDWVRRLLIHLAIAFLVAAFMEVVRLLLFRSMLFPDGIGPIRLRHRFDIGRSLLRLQSLDELVIYLAVLAAGFARDYFLRFRERQAEAARLLAETTRLQAQLADARLDALRMQLNPHFLFNTLHAVSALVERDPSGVRRIVARLSTLLRRALDDSTPQEVPLRDELDFLRGYLDIQRVRFQESLGIQEDIAADTLDALVPNLILQPLVENAIEHGVSRVEAGAGRIELAAWRKPAPAEAGGDRLVLTVRDNGPGLTGNGDREGGVGLRNTRARLDALYGDDAHLDLAPAEGSGLVATITLPYHTAADLRTTARDDV